MGGFTQINPIQGEMWAEAQHVLLAMRGDSNCSMQGKSRKIQISTSGTVKQHRKLRLKGKKVMLVLVVKNTLALKADRSGPKSQLPSDPIKHQPQLPPL